MTNELYHHGILGQKWGIRRFQNKDGSLTAAGKRREAKRLAKEMNKLDQEVANNTVKALAAQRNFDFAMAKHLRLEGRDGRRAQKKLQKVIASEKKFFDEYNNYLKKGADSERRLREVEDFIRKSADYNFKTQFKVRTARQGDLVYESYGNKYKVKTSDKSKNWSNRRIRDFDRFESPEQKKSSSKKDPLDDPEYRELLEMERESIEDDISKFGGPTEWDHKQNRDVVIEGYDINKDPEFRKLDEWKKKHAK